MVTFRPLVSAIALGGLLAVGVISGNALASSRSGEPGITPHANLPYAKVMPALLPNSKENTSVIVQNNGSAAATIAMDIFTPGGVLIPSASRVETNVPPHGTRTFPQAINAGLTPGFRGVGQISSDQPINALLVRDLEENGSGRHGYSVHNAYGTGGSVVTLPFIANNLDSVYQTRFAIANTGNVISCVTINYAFDGGGSFSDAPTGLTGCATGYPVPVGGQVAFGPKAVAAEATQAMPAATAGRLMSATVNAAGSPVTVAVDAYRTNNGRFQLASYDGFNVGAPASVTDDLGTTVIAPVALKVDGFYTQFLMSNPGGTAANVTITYRSESGQTFTATRSIAASGTANQGVYSADSTVPEGFQGAATITSDQPIAVLIVRAKMTSPGSFVDEDLYTSVNGVPSDQAAKTAQLPLIFRRAYGNNGQCESSSANCGYNTWVSVSVPGGGTANVTLTTVADTTTGAPGCSSPATYTTTRIITGSYIFYQNANNSGTVNNGLGANPSCLWGGMAITSDVPVIVVADVTSDLAVGDNDGLYNAFAN